MFSFQETRGAVEVAFTDRYADRGPGAALDLAEPALDHPRREAELTRLRDSLEILRRAVAGARGPSPVVARVRQVHGAHVETVDRSWLQRHDPDAEPAEADGLVTAAPGVALLVRAADCVPVLLADVARGIVGAAHAGREGLVAGVVPATVERMRECGAHRIVAWIGPHICGRCYEVPADLCAEVAETVPESLSETAWGTPALDVGAGVTAQLEGLGVEVVDVSRCTLESEDLYSYRGEGGSAGRLGGTVWVRP